MRPLGALPRHLVGSSADAGRRRAVTPRRAGLSAVAPPEALGRGLFTHTRRWPVADRTEQGVVTVRGGAEGFAQEITAGRHRLIADEPVAAGGSDRGPGPYDLLLAALGA